MLKKMILTLALSLGVFLGMAQNIHLNLKNVTVQQAITELQKQSGYTVAIKTDEIDMMKIITVSANEIESALYQIFKGQDAKFNIRGKEITVSKAPVKPASARQTANPSIRGTVTDKQGLPIMGASVLVKGSLRGTVTDLNGTYSIEAKNGEMLEFAFLGMTTKVVEVGAKNVIDVTLEENSAFLDEIVVVAYGSQKRSSITGAISTVSDKDILKSPTMSISNVIGSRVSGISAVQNSGQPGSDDASLTIRGQGSIIYIIDGIRRTAADFNGLDPNEIESVSVLKDASAVAVYGLDANGAFIVTTKRGENDSVKISYTGTLGVSMNAVQHDYLDGPEYAYWYNKALENVGSAPLFTAEQVQKMKDGVDGWGNTDWYEEMWGTGVNTHHNLSASGGTKKVQFFTTLGYMGEKGNLANFNYDRYNLRSNVNAELSKGLSMALGVSARIEDRNTPGIGADPKGFLTLPIQICYALPFVPKTVADTDGTEYYVATPTNSQPVSPLGVDNQSGYNRSSKTYTQTNLTLKYDAPWLKGLSVKFTGAYDAVNSMGKSLKTPMQVMVASFPSSMTDEIVYTKKNYSVVGDTPVLTESASRSATITSQTSASYNNSFGKHTFGLLALAETRQVTSNNMGVTGYGLDFIQLDELSKITNLSNGQEAIPEISGASSMSRSAGFVGRFNYNYDERFFLEGSIRYDGSYLFGGMNKRWVTLPGLSTAWRISQEDWFNVGWIDELKIRGGIGKTATSGVSSFLWMNTMALNPNSVVIGGSSQSGISASVLGNPNLTWSQCLNYNVGVNATLFGGKIYLEADTFYKYEFDKLSNVTGAYPLSMGGYYFTSANVNKIDIKGFDITVNHRDKVGDLNYGIKLIWSYAYARWLKYAGDSKDTQEWSRLTGKQVGSQLALIDLGLYQSQEEIDNSAFDPTRPPLPGYIRYKDMDGDGIINYRKDQGYFSRSVTPSHTGSIDLSASWKGFDFNCLFSWGLGNEVPISGLYVGFSGTSNYVQALTEYSKAFYQNGNTPKYLVENSWTPDNPDAEFPCLEVTGRGTSNAYCSTFWNRNGAYLRLKTAQFGYSLPDRWLKSLPLEMVRFYVEGFNLFTFSELTKFNIDPESPGVNNGYYPQQRTVSAGVKVTFK